MAIKHCAEGLEEAADYVGVSPSTISKWLSDGRFAFGEAEMVQVGNTRRWSITYDSLDYVKRTALSQGPGAYKAQWIKHHRTPIGYVMISIEDTPVPVLVGLLHEYVSVWENVRKAQEDKTIEIEQHKTLRNQTHALHAKCREIIDHLEAKNVSYIAPRALENLLKSLG